MQKQNGDSLMEPHIPIRLTVDFSHMHCQVGWGGRGGEGRVGVVGMRRRVGLNTVAAVQQERRVQGSRGGNTCTLHTSDDVHRTLCVV